MWYLLMSLTLLREVALLEEVVDYLVAVASQVWMDLAMVRTVVEVM